MKLKKLIATILAVISAASIAVGISGCKDEISLPPMTAETPFYKFQANEASSYKNFYGYDKETLRDGYEMLLDYYNGEFKQVCGEKYYLCNLELVEPENSKAFNIANKACQVFFFEQSNAELTSLILERFSVYDSNLGDSRDNGSVAPWSINFQIYLMPVQDEILDENLKLDFGKTRRENYYDYFTNMYLGKTCIGTCFFDANVSISYEWFEDFFTRHLVYGG